MGQFGAGQAVRRVEDQRLLTGHGRYTDDMTFPGQTYAAFVRSPHAHARIDMIDTEEALARPGVLTVLTHADLAADGIGHLPCKVDLETKDKKPIIKPPRPALADGRVRFVGDPVAMVVAETQEAARDATEFVAVDYTELPAVVETGRAAEDGAPLVWDECALNTSFQWQNGDQAAVETAFDEAAHTVQIDLINNRIIPSSMEPRIAIGVHDTENDKLTLYTPSQGPHFIKDQLVEDIFNIPSDKIRVVTPDVGGAFGMKLFLYPEQVLVLWAARRLGRPVRWTSDRSEAFLSDNHGRDHVSEAEMAFDGEARILGLKVRTTANLGAYLSNFSPYVVTVAGSSMLVGVYRTPAVVHDVRAVFTNTAPIDAYRGAGRPEANYLVERLLDVAARDLGLDRDEIRRRNFIAPGEMPYRTPMNQTYDSGEFARNMQEAQAKIGWDEREERRQAAAARGRLYGIGLATYIESCGGGAPETARLEVDPGGEVRIFIGTQSNGQGLETAYAQVASDTLDLPLEQLRVIQGDTDTVPHGFGTAGSRSLPVGGAAVKQASAALIETAKEVAAKRLEAAAADIEFEAGVFRIVGTDRTVTLFDLAAEPLGAEMSRTPEVQTFPNGCHMCEVEIDRETGALEILSYVAVDDFGKLINPLLAAGQVHGGIVQGIGQAVHEMSLYDSESGQLLTGSFMDYRLPRAGDIPSLDIAYNEIPCKTNPLGIKGAGEAGAVGAPPAIVNAIVDALSHLGVTHIDMPVTPEKLWRTMRDVDPG